MPVRGRDAAQRISLPCAARTRLSLCGLPAAGRARCRPPDCRRRPVRCGHGEVSDCRAVTSAPSAAGGTTKWAGRCGECEAWGSVAEAGPAGRHVLPRPAPRVPLGPGRRRSPGRCPDRPGRRGRGPGPARPAWTSWTGCSAAGWCPARSCCWPGSRASASPPCCWRPARWRPRPGRVLYVTGEESAAQVRLRADRIGAISDSLFLAAETDFAALLGHVEAVDPTPAHRRLGADHQRGRRRRRARRGHPGARGHRRAHRAGQAAHADDRAGRARDQGRLGGRAAHAGAPGRRGAAASTATRAASCGWCGR